MKFLIKTLTICLTIGLFVACQQKKEPISNEGEVPSEPKITPLVEKVLTKEEQAKLTPDDVVQMLKDGNERFLDNALTARDHTSQVRMSANGQFPKSVVLSCVDSRIPVEDVFDKGIGDTFVARVAGNFINEDILGSMEYSCKVAGAKVVLVMGHESCGAVKSAIDGVKVGNITAMLSKINPAIEMLADYEGEKTSSNKEFVTLVEKQNIHNAIERIRLESEILRDMEENGEIKIVGAFYDMDTGEVEFLEDK